MLISGRLQHLARLCLCALPCAGYQENDDASDHCGRCYAAQKRRNPLLAPIIPLLPLAASGRGAGVAGRGVGVAVRLRGRGTDRGRGWRKRRVERQRCRRQNDQQSEQHKADHIGAAVRPHNDIHRVRACVCVCVCGRGREEGERKG